MCHSLFAIFGLLGALSAGADSSAESAKELLWAKLDRSDLFEFDGRIGACMEAKIGAVKLDTMEFLLRRKSAQCPVPRPSVFKVVLSKGVVLESESGLALEVYVQGVRMEKMRLSPAWAGSGLDGDTFCDESSNCDVITAGGGGSIKKR